MRRLTELMGDRRGATAVEYGLIVALIVVAMLAGLGNFSRSAIRLYGYIASQTTAVL